VADVPQVRAVSSVGFLPDESAMYSVSSDGDEGRVVLTPVDGKAARLFSLERADRAAVHPSGAWLAVTDNSNRLFVIDLPSGRVRLAGFVGGRALFSPRQQQLAAQLGAGQPECRTEKVFCLRFDAAGDYLCLATMAGVRVLNCRDVRDADGTLPTPTFAIAAAGLEVAISKGAIYRGSSYVYDLEHDGVCNRLLFAGLDGRVGYLDLSSGNLGTLLEVPDRPAIQRLALSGARPSTRG
jgi:hypothetical protein